MKVIRFFVDDYRPADDLVHMEAPGENLHIGASMIGKQRRQIPRMARVFRPARIEVATGIGKTCSVTAFSLMDVKGKEACFRFWKPIHLRFDQDTVPSLKESHNSPQSWMAAVSPKHGSGANEMVMLHFITPPSILCA